MWNIKSYFMIFIYRNFSRILSTQIISFCNVLHHFFHCLKFFIFNYELNNIYLQLQTFSDFFKSTVAFTNSHVYVFVYNLLLLIIFSALQVHVWELSLAGRKTKGGKLQRRRKENFGLSIRTICVWQAYQAQWDQQYR